MSTVALRVDGISKCFGRVAALDGVDFTVPQGSLVVLLGAAGAGKTTTLRSIAGLDVPDRGRIIIGGRDVTDVEPKNRDIAMIFDNLALYPNKTGFKNIAHPLELRKWSKAAIEQKVNEVAATLRISHVLSRLPKTMSGGERQRVALGRALVRDPSLFLLDEPLSSLDAMLRIELRAELKRMQRENGYALLLATPDYSEALAVADVVVMLVNGVVRQVAPPQTLYDAPVDRDIARFVGAPEINLLPAQYDPGDGGRVRLAGTVLPAPPALRAVFNGAPARFEAGLRPEHLSLQPGGQANATVIDIEPLGLQSAVTLDSECGALRLVVAAAEARRLATGERVAVRHRLERMVAFDISSGRRLA